jgi:hypothetical protein
MAKVDMALSDSGPRACSGQLVLPYLSSGNVRLQALTISKTARPFRALALIGNAVQNFAFTRTSYNAL